MEEWALWDEWRWEEEEIAAAAAEDEILMMPRVRRVVPDRMNPFQAMSDVEFTERFRLAKATANSIIQEIQHRLPVANDRRGCPVPPHLQVLLSIACMASGSHQVYIGDCYDVSQTKVSQCLSNVARAIAFLSHRYIKFPSGVAMYNTIHGFSGIAGMPGVSGCIDCTYVRIRRPSRNDSELFRCRKGYFALNVQAVCGPDLSLYDIVVRWPGSVHDSRIFENSRICARLHDGELPGHFLGDSGYPCRPYLLTPLSAPACPKEVAYNTSHIKTRNTVERAFGVLKKRFAYLGGIVRTHLNTTKAIIVACAVLHNIAIRTRVEMEEDLVNVANIVPADVHLHVNVNARQNLNESVLGRLKRQQIIRDYF